MRYPDPPGFEPIRECDEHIRECREPEDPIPEDTRRDRDECVRDERAELEARLAKWR